MRIFFHNPSFDNQLLRTISCTYFQCADIGECLSTANRIKEGDFESWYKEWVCLADKVKSHAEASEEKGHYISAMNCFFRASNYYKTALYFLYRDPIEDNLMITYEKHCQAFTRALKLRDRPVESIKIPGDKTSFPGNFYITESSESYFRPVIIVNGGYDSTHQEAYFSFVPEALKRGYHVLAFDGPGQGQLLFKEKIPMIHNWETVIRSVIDYLYTRTDVDKEKIVLYGPSWGGYLAPRAASYELRLAACIANPGHYDVMENLKQLTHTEGEGEQELSWEAFIQAAMKEKHVAAKFQAKMFVHGCNSPHDLFEEWKKYSLKECAENIQCPTLILDEENEPLNTGQAKELFDKIKSPKEYILLKNTEGAGEHAAYGAFSLLYQHIFDWLDTKLKLTSTSAQNTDKQKAIALGFIDSSSK